MDFIPQWVMGYFILPTAFLSIYILGFSLIFHLLEKMCKKDCY